MEEADPGFGSVFWTGEGGGEVPLGISTCFLLALLFSAAARCSLATCSRNIRHGIRSSAALSSPHREHLPGNKRIYMLHGQSGWSIRVQKQKIYYSIETPVRARLVRAQEWQQQAAQQGIITASRRISEQRTHCSSCNRAARADITRLDSI